LTGFTGFKELKVKEGSPGYEYVFIPDGVARVE
jgi:hypothetical protein